MTRMWRKSQPELPLESPISFHCGSNGEFVPRDPGAREQRAETMFRALVDERTRKLGISRRAFLDSMAGTATALFVIQQLGCGRGGGGYPVDAASTWDAAQACTELGGDQFIFDVQTHHVDADGAWRTGDQRWQQFLASVPQGGCGEADVVDCFDRSHYIREVFVNSDTHVAALSAVPSQPGTNPLETAEQAATMKVVNDLAGSQRLVIHGLVHPERGQAELEAMQKQKEDHRVAAWKLYTLWGDWRLDDAIGRAFLDRARALEIKNVCVHKGLPLAGTNPVFTAPADVGPAAAAYPDLRFLIYHSAYDLGVQEGPYDPDGKGVDRLIRTCLDHGIGPGGNVWAELGATWRLLMLDPVQAQHVLGKLLKHLGPERILWGTDSIWFGSPQAQITAFRALTISEELQAKHGYPALTAEVKARILGLNAAALYGIEPAARRCVIEADDLAAHKRRSDAEGVPRRSLSAYGPRTRRQFFSFLRERGGTPG